MVPLEKLAQITQRFEFLEAKLNAGASPAEIATLSREYSDLKPVADEIVDYRRALDDLAEAELLLADPETFVLHPHYKAHKLILVMGGRIDSDWAKARLIRQWRDAAAKRWLKSWDADQATS